MTAPDARRERPRTTVLTVPVAEAIIGGSLSRPSKMPCVAWGISADACRRGSRLALKSGTVCAACYARRGHYSSASVIAAHERRLAALADPLWPDAMAVLIDAYCRGDFFRWFDAGDIQSLAHLDQILWVARRTPSVRHWLPTHETGIVRHRLAAIPSNVTIRVSADRIGAPATNALGLPTSTVHRDIAAPVRIASKRSASIECLAYLRAHRCGSCRACWSSKVANVSYLLNAGLRFLSRDTKRIQLSVVA